MSAKKTAKTAKTETKVAKAQPKAEPVKETVRLRIFKLLKKHPDGLTAAQIVESLGLNKPVPLIKHECMAAKPRMHREKHEDVRAVVYSLTAAGKAAIDKGTVDSEPAPSSVGSSDLRGGE